MTDKFSMTNKFDSRFTIGLRYKPRIIQMSGRAILSLKISEMEALRFYEPAMKTSVIIAGENSIESADAIMSSRLIRTMDAQVSAPCIWPPCTPVQPPTE